MAKETYEVLRDGITVHKDVRPLNNPLTGEPSGRFQMGGGRVYLEGEKIDGADVASMYKEALEDSDHPLHETISQKLKKSTGDAQDNVARRLGLPFEGYDEMETSDIVQAMRNLPSVTVQRIKEYESQRDEPRTEIVDYNIGFGGHPDDRQLAQPELPEPDENKVVREGVTREVPDDGPVQHGEGVTGTGEAKKPFGSTAASAKSSPQRKGRRSRSTSSESSGSGSSDS